MALQEAVDIYRSLAAERPEAFSADLALLLANLALNLDEADRTEEALAAATEGMARLAPLFLRLPPAYAQPMALVSYRYYELSEKLGREMDMTLLGPVYATLQMLSRAEGSGG